MVCKFKFVRYGNIKNKLVFYVPRFNFDGLLKSLRILNSYKVNLAEHKRESNTLVCNEENNFQLREI